MLFSLFAVPSYALIRQHRTVAGQFSLKHQCHIRLWDSFNRLAVQNSEWLHGKFLWQQKAAKVLIRLLYFSKTRLTARWTDYHDTIVTSSACPYQKTCVSMLTFSFFTIFSVFQFRLSYNMHTTIDTHNITLFCTGELSLFVHPYVLCPGWQLEVVFVVLSCLPRRWQRKDPSGGLSSQLVLHAGLVYRSPQRPLLIISLPDTFHSVTRRLMLEMRQFMVLWIFCRHEDSFN